MNFCASNIFFSWSVARKNRHYWLSYVWNSGNNRIDSNWYIGSTRSFRGEVRKKIIKRLKESQYLCNIREELYRPSRAGSIFLDSKRGNLGRVHKSKFSKKFPLVSYSFCNLLVLVNSKVDLSGLTLCKNSSLSKRITFPCLYVWLSTQWSTTTCGRMFLTCVQQ